MFFFFYLACICLLCFVIFYFLFLGEGGGVVGGGLLKFINWKEATELFSKWYAKEFDGLFFRVNFHMPAGNALLEDICLVTQF